MTEYPRAKTTAERSFAYRRRRGLTPRPLQPCGTIAAYRRHWANGELACRACCDAKSAYTRARYAAVGR